MLIERLMKLALLGSEWVLYLLLVLSVLSIATMVERWVYFLRRTRHVEELSEDLLKRLGKSDVAGALKLAEAHGSVQARIAVVALRWLRNGPDASTDAVEAELARVRKELEKGLSLLGTLGNNAPFIGLFGTVLGVIIAFDALGEAGGNANAMGGVMAGIAEALVATGVGLFVALPAVVAFNIIQRKIGDVEAESATLVKFISAYAKGDASLQAQSLALSEQAPEAAESSQETGDAAPAEASAESKEANTESETDASPEDRVSGETGATSEDEEEEDEDEDDEEEDNERRYSGRVTAASAAKG